MAKFNKDMTIREVLNTATDKDAVAEVFFKMGMHCLGCPSASGETVAQAAAVHGQDADKLLAELEAAEAK